MDRAVTRESSFASSARRVHSVVEPGSGLIDLIDRLLPVETLTVGMTFPPVSRMIFVF